MLSPLHAPFQKDFLSPSRPGTPSAAQRFIAVYLKPFALATVVTVLLSFAVCFVLVTLAENIFIEAKTSETKQDMQQNDPDTFIKMIRQTHGTSSTTTTHAFATVRLAGNTLYRLQRQSTHQEIATTNEKIRQQIMRQLDANGIEYEVFKNTGETFLIHKGEWIVSWGGILYLPEVAAFI